MQPKEEIERSYETPDPWNYQTNSQDLNRKQILLALVDQFTASGPRARAIDICCGEGWITKDLPFHQIHGIEISDNAASRFPANVTRVSEPIGKYDFIMATGCLYGHYDWSFIVNCMKFSSRVGSIILISNIETWEYQGALKFIPGKQIFEARFPYNEHHQKVRVFRV